MEKKTTRDDERASDRVVLGRALRELRMAAHLTQEELARRAGTDNTYISHAEAGRFGVGWDTVMRLVRAMGLTIGELAAEVERQLDTRG
jgi:transcriptional regulator with XRE-family HTH domain